MAAKRIVSRSMQVMLSCVSRSLFFLLVGSFLALTACGGKSSPPFDPSPYETPSALAVLREVLREAREAQAISTVGVVMLGEKLNDSTPAFRAALKDTGIQWHPGADITQVWIGPIARVIEKTSKLQPIQLQVVSVSKRDAASSASAEEVVAAWAFEDRMVRRRYLATPATGGSWSVQALEIVEQRPAPSL